MLSTIKLDDESGVGTTEVDDVSINWHLSLELQAPQSPPAKLKPEHALGVGLIATEPPCGSSVPIHRRSPLTPTLSPPGRGSSPSSWNFSKPNR
jgi:hypothetical protein